MFGTCPGLLSRPVGRPSFRISAVAVVFVVSPAVFLYSGSDPWYSPENLVGFRYSELDGMKIVRENF